MGDETLDILRAWRQRQAELVGAAEHAFTTLEGKPLNHRYVQAMVQRYAAKAGITKHVTPHTLRHTFGTCLLRATKNVVLVQKALGYANLSTT